MGGTCPRAWESSRQRNQCQLRIPKGLHKKHNIIKKIIRLDYITDAMKKKQEKIKTCG
jgi:hypothetical protein